MDLVVISSGYALNEGDSLLADHLYLNDGKGNLSEEPQRLPAVRVNSSCIAAGDIDNDEDMDLFMGTLGSPAAYGIYQKPMLYLNDGNGKFSPDDKILADLAPTGITTCALMADMDRDGLTDPVLAGEWMPLTIISQKEKVYRTKQLPETSGWWQCLQLADLNEDGKPDLLAGNWGINSKLAAGKNGPLKLYTKDFDNNGTIEQILAYTINGEVFPFYAKDELERAIPVLKKGYLTYGEVAGKTVEYIFYDLFKGYSEWTAEQLQSCAFVNGGNNSFSMEPLPMEWQLAPIFAFANVSPNHWIAGGNFNGSVPYEGKYSALFPSAFSGAQLLDTNGRVAPLMRLPTKGNIRAMLPLKVGNHDALLIGINNAAVQLWGIKQQLQHK